MSPTLKIFVQCPKALRVGFDQVQRSIEASDIGTDYTLCMHPPGRTVFEHFLGMLDQMAQADADLVVRLEDDVDVNRHFCHNVVTWPTIHHPDFGMGWLFDPGARTYTIHNRLYNQPPTKEFWENSMLAYSLAVVMWRRDVPRMRQFCASWYAKHGGDAQDLALSAAPRSIGKGLVVHAPSLVEHRLDLPSTLGHGHSRHATSDGAFFKDWKRPADAPAYGRAV